METSQSNGVDPQEFLSEADKDLAAMSQEVTRMRDELKTLYTLAAASSVQSGKTFQEAKEDILGAFKLNQELTRKVAAADERVRDIERSTSWRITAPLRMVSSGIRAVLRLGQSR